MDHKIFGTVRQNCDTTSRVVKSAELDLNHIDHIYLPVSFFQISLLSKGKISWFLPQILVQIFESSRNLDSKIDSFCKLDVRCSRNFVQFI